MEFRPGMVARLRTAPETQSHRLVRLEGDHADHSCERDAIVWSTAVVVLPVRPARVQHDRPALQFVVGDPLRVEATRRRDDDGALHPFRSKRGEFQDLHPAERATDRTGDATYP